MTVEIKVPAVGESISEVEIGSWTKKEGDPVTDGEIIAVIESEKATVDLPAPASGVLGKILKSAGKVARIGEVIASIETRGAATPIREATPAPSVASSTSTASSIAQASPAISGVAPKVMPAAQRILAEAGIAADTVTPSGPGGRILKEDALAAAASLAAVAKPVTESRAKLTPTSASVPATTPQQTPPPSPTPIGRSEEIVRMTKLRRTVAARLVSAKQEMALVTTFNEIDMSFVMGLRKDLQETFMAKHGVKLGFMSFFVKATIDALKLIPQLNAEIRGEDLVYRHYYDVGVAIGGGKGLVVPILRDADRMGFADIEKAIAALAGRAKDGKLMPDELEGGTFTITNGGVYGSLLSTPIVNPPQSGVLGMHTIQERPVAINGQVVIRPMMYVALTYDHRIVDGKEGVTFLKRIKETIENPARILLET